MTDVIHIRFIYCNKTRLEGFLGHIQSKKVEDVYITVSLGTFLFIRFSRSVTARSAVLYPQQLHRQNDGDIMDFSITLLHTLQSSISMNPNSTSLFITIIHSLHRNQRL